MTTARFLPGKIVAGRRPNGRGKTGDRAAIDDLAAGRAGAGTEVDNMVGAPDDVLIVLDHHQRVAKVAQILERPDQPADLARMQAERGLIEHIQGIDQPRAQDLGQPDALKFARRQRPHRAIEGQVIKPDRRQIAEPVFDLGQDGGRTRLTPQGRQSVEKATDFSGSSRPDSPAMSRPSILTARASGRNRAP